MTAPEVAVEECDRLLRLIDLAVKQHPRIPSGKHERRSPPPAQFEAIYSRLFVAYEDPDFSVFAEPVNAVELGIPNYYTIIQRPVSIRNVLDDIAARRYANEAEVRASLELLRENSAKFNGPTSEYTMLAQRLAQRINDELRLATPEELARFQDLVNASDEETMQRAFHAIKTEAPHLVSGDDMVDLDNLHAGLVNHVVNLLQRSESGGGGGSGM